jgi:hypothetical protein
MPDKLHHSQDLDPPSPALRQWDVGVDQKWREPIARIWEEGAPNDMRIFRITSMIDIRPLPIHCLIITYLKQQQKSKVKAHSRNH